MKPFRKHMAIAIDGGGIRGVAVTRALFNLETELGKPVHELFQLAVGTSTGSIISAGIASRLTALKMFDLYVQLGQAIFPRTLRSFLFPLTRYRYARSPLQNALDACFGERKMGSFWSSESPFDIVITTFDLLTNHTRFIKPWKDEYKDWPVVQAVLCSCTVPTYFPVIEGRYVDGGVGSYANPCYIAAYEAIFCLGWDPAETTLISLGTGRSPHRLESAEANRLRPWQWIDPILGAFLQSADDQQVHLVNTFFEQMDFRRFNFDMQEDIEMDDPGQMQKLVRYGDILGEKILNDEVDPILTLTVKKPQPFDGE
ncbi:MAG: patatin-like phospholipase family protein [Anaerolineae bacterium]|nr:patatin-like phospholipase family protein [Anaerolineae bacterium]